MQTCVKDKKDEVEGEKGALIDHALVEPFMSGQLPQSEPCQIEHQCIPPKSAIDTENQFPQFLQPHPVAPKGTKIRGSTNPLGVNIALPGTNNKIGISCATQGQRDYLLATLGISKEITGERILHGTQGIYRDTSLKIDGVDTPLVIVQDTSAGGELQEQITLTNTIPLSFCQPTRPRKLLSSKNPKKPLTESGLPAPRIQSEIGKTNFKIHQKFESYFRKKLSEIHEDERYNLWKLFQGLPDTTKELIRPGWNDPIKHYPSLEEQQMGWDLLHQLKNSKNREQQILEISQHLNRRVLHQPKEFGIETLHDLPLSESPSKAKRVMKNNPKQVLKNNTTKQVLKKRVKKFKPTCRSTRAIATTKKKPSPKLNQSPPSNPIGSTNLGRKRTQTIPPSQNQLETFCFQLKVWFASICNKIGLEDKVWWNQIWSQNGMHLVRSSTPPEPQLNPVFRTPPKPSEKGAETPAKETLKFIPGYEFFDTPVRPHYFAEDIDIFHNSSKSQLIQSKQFRYHKPL